jgi:predicted transcriptional regulator
LAKDLIEKNKSSNEISELLGISKTAARTLCIKVSNVEGEIIKKKGRKKDCSVIRSLISSTLLNENSLNQKVIAERLNASGIENQKI